MRDPRRITRTPPNNTTSSTIYTSMGPRAPGEVGGPSTCVCEEYAIEDMPPSPATFAGCKTAHTLERIGKVVSTSGNTDHHPYQCRACGALFLQLIDTDEGCGSHYLYRLAREPSNYYNLRQRGRTDKSVWTLPIPVSYRHRTLIEVAHAAKRLVDADLNNAYAALNELRALLGAPDA